MSTPTTTEEAARLRGEAASQLLNTVLTQSKIKLAIIRLSQEFLEKPPKHYETFKDIYMEAFVQTYKGTGSLLTAARKDLQAVAGASAASLAPTGALSQVMKAEDNLRSVAIQLDKLADDINDLLNSEKSKDSYKPKFTKAMSSMNHIQGLLDNVLNALKALLLQK